MYLSQLIFLFSLGKYPEVGLLDPMVVVFLILGETSTPFYSLITL